MVLGYRLQSPYRKEGMGAWRISFVREYDLEPVLKSRALGRFKDSFAHNFYFQHTTQHHSAIRLGKTGTMLRVYHTKVLW